MYFLILSIVAFGIYIINYLINEINDINVEDDINNYYNLRRKDDHILNYKGFETMYESIKEEIIEKYKVRQNNLKGINFKFLIINFGILITLYFLNIDIQLKNMFLNFYMKFLILVIILTPGINYAFKIYGGKKNKEKCIIQILKAIDAFLEYEYIEEKIIYKIDDYRAVSYVRTIGHEFTMKTDTTMYFNMELYDELSIDKIIIITDQVYSYIRELGIDYNSLKFEILGKNIKIKYKMQCNPFYYWNFAFIDKANLWEIYLVNTEVILVIKYLLELIEKKENIIKI